MGNLGALRQRWFSQAVLCQTSDKADVQVAALVGSELERLGLECTDVLPEFHVPQSVREKFQLAGAAGDEMAANWENMLKQYYKTFSATEPELVADLERRALSNTEEGEESGQNGEVKHKAGRVYASEILKCFVASNPAVIGGSPDVASSCGGHFPSIQGTFLPPSYGVK